MNTLEHMVEAAILTILRDRVDGVHWLHYEHEVVDTEGSSVGIVKLERGEPVAECFHRSDLVLHVIGARDETHRQIDEALGSRYDLAEELEALNPELAIRNIRGWAITRANEDNIYARTWTNEVEVAYQQTN